MKVKKAVIPVAGLGTRFLPATKAQPKEMLPIFDKPAIQYVVEEAINSEVEEIIMVTGRGKQAIENHFDKSFELEYYLKEKKQFKLLKHVEWISELVHIHYVRQKEPMGLGHAILCTKSFIGNEPFAVFLADDIIYSKKPAIKQLIEVYNRYKKPVLAVEEIEKDNLSNYGVIKAKEIHKNIYEVEDIVEKPSYNKAPSNLAVVGRYILHPGIMSVLEKTSAGRLGEIQLTDAIRTLNKEEHFLAVKFEGRRYDVGTKLGYIEATVEYALRDRAVAPKFKHYIERRLKL